MSAETVPRREEGRMTLVEHLLELRSRLVKAVVAVGAGTLIAFVFYPQIFEFLIQPYRQIAADGMTLDPEGRLLLIDPLEGFTVRLRVSLYGGLFLAMPVVLWQVWRFVTPGLYPNERRYAVPFVVSAMALFLLGASLAYYTMPRALQFLVTIGGEDLVTAFAPGRYLQLITYMMLAFGLGFQFPILLIFLQLAGVLDPRTLAGGRRYAIVGVVVLVAVITPSADPYSLLILSVPMIVFYELSILVGKLLQRRRAVAEVPS